MTLMAHEMPAPSASRLLVRSPDPSHSFEHENEAQEDHAGSGPLPTAQPVGKKRPAEYDDPKRHRVAEHGALTRCADVERPRDQADEAGRLKNAEEDRLDDMLGFHGGAHRPQHGEQQNRAEDTAQRSEVHRPDVLHRDFHHDPVVTPDQRQQTEREHRAGRRGATIHRRSRGIHRTATVPAPLRSMAQVANRLRGPLSFALHNGDEPMPPTTRFSRRTTLIAGVGLALGTTALPGNAQPPAERRTPENETRWARMGVGLTGKTALVTGSTDGLGKEVARQLGALGALVIVHGRNQERGDEVVALDQVRRYRRRGVLSRRPRVVGGRRGVCQASARPP